MNFKPVILILTTFTLFFSCKKEFDFKEEAETEKIFDPCSGGNSYFRKSQTKYNSEDLNTFKGEVFNIEKLFIKVVTENGEPISNASINYNEPTDNTLGLPCFSKSFKTKQNKVSTLKTDNKGFVILNNINANENTLSFSVTAEGFIESYKNIKPSNNTFINETVILTKADKVEIISSNTETTIQTDNSNAKVNLKGEFTTLDNTEYNGSVVVSIKHLSTANENTFDLMPGNLTAINNNNEIRLLESYGMIAVELKDLDGNKLQIDENHPATLTFPINPDQAHLAPETIPLWYYDELNNIWVEDGEATKSGDKYIGEVSHFTWWNADFPIDLVNFCLNVKNTPGNQNLPNQKVTIKRKSTNQTIFKGTTDKEGKICGSIPKNELVSISVFDKEISCLVDGKLFNGDFGSYSTNGNVIDISVNKNDSNLVDYNISGTFDNCNSTSSSSKIIEMVQQGKSHIIPVNEDNTFSYDFYGCDSETIYLTGFDVNNYTYSSEIEINLNESSKTINVGDLGGECSQYNSTYFGDVFIYNEEELTAFGAKNYKEINGNLQITGITTNFSPLISLERVTGNITFTYYDEELEDEIWNYSLESLEGLNNLTEIGGSLSTWGLQSNPDLTALSNLKKIDYIQIYDHNTIENLNFLNSLSEVNKISVYGCNNLKTLEGLENLTQLKEIEIKYCYNLTNINGLNNIKRIESYIGIEHSRTLTNLNGLDNLEYVRYFFLIDNESLETVNGSPKLNSINSRIYIMDNPLLTNFYEWEDVQLNVTSGNWFMGQGPYNVNRPNGYNPTKEQILNGECSK